MLNFRRLKQDFPPAILKDGKQCETEGAVCSAKILCMDKETIRIGAEVRGNFDNVYECEVEIDRRASELIDSNCDCTYQFDCQHLAAVLFYLETHLNALVVDFSKHADLEEAEIDFSEVQQLAETIERAKEQETVRQGRHHQKELINEYLTAANILAASPYFLPAEALAEDKGELAMIIASDSLVRGPMKTAEIQLALRLPHRSKPLYIPNVTEFLDAITYREPLTLGGRRHFFTPSSFDEESYIVLQAILHSVRPIPSPVSGKGERAQRMVAIDGSVFGALLAEVYDHVVEKMQQAGCTVRGGESLVMPRLYVNSLEHSLTLSATTAQVRVAIDYLEAPAPKLCFRPSIVLNDAIVPIDEVCLIGCARPGLLQGMIYYRFKPQIRRLHLRDLYRLREMTIPEPLFGTFVENSLPELSRFAEISGEEELEHFVTLPYVKEVKARCAIEYLDGELEASLYFQYDDIEVPTVGSKVAYEDVSSFLNEDGILARNLVDEQEVVEDLFSGFVHKAQEGTFLAKTERKIVEFMTEIIPRNQHRVTFECPDNLKEQFLYDKTTFSLHLKESDRVDVYTVAMEVQGDLKGIAFDRLWESISANRTYIELIDEAQPKRGRKGKRCPHKILVLDLERLAPVVQFFDELGLRVLDNCEQERPLWSLASIQPSSMKELGVTISMSNPLRQIQAQMLGKKEIVASPLPEAVDANLRSYQLDGVHWLERLRLMHLSGILADDMGLGKTLQAITAITQYVEDKKSAPTSLVVCPTSLVYNWREECHRFNANLKILVVDGAPAQRKKLIEKAEKFDVVITSYSLLQKDVETYQAIQFGYAILDEAQHIKNRTTRNAKSVKQIQARHRLILTGTPIENSLEELWSLFDFLMPGLLSSYERFVDRYIRQAELQNRPLDTLSRKVAPFILRRMKVDVLDDLPPINEMIYYCHLSKVQRELYQSYAASAREELSRLVQKEGFDRVQIHVLATLTRLKQICCHPAIFAKDEIEESDSAKYDMLLELLHGLIEGKHKTVIFSQYTRMLKIMRNDLERIGIRYNYLDGSSKNRMEIVKSFNEDPNIMVFLVSLKAGGTGLNLTGADAVIHYDLWWNPAVQDQATDRVHRIGQQKQVSSMKLVTLGTIEEKVLELQKRKQGLVKQVVSADDEVVSKLTWEEVLELLQV